MQMFEDLEPRKKKTFEFPRNIENMSIEELESYIMDMNAEIARVQADIKKKKASRDAAASVFKS